MAGCVKITNNTVGCFTEFVMPYADITVSIANFHGNQGKAIALISTKANLFQSSAQVEKLLTQLYGCVFDQSSKRP